jgi:nucleotide-binding universal stress UspA family protein
MIIRSYQEGYDGLKGLNYERLLLPLDGSKRAECVLPLAKSISSAHNSTVFLTHIVEEPKLPRQTPLSDEDKKLVSRLSQINIDESEKYFKNLITQFENQQVEMIIESSRKPTIALHNIVDREKINLVLLSAHGYSGENRWPYGKIALNFIVYGTTPLLILQDLSQDEVAKTLAEKYAEQSKGH